MLWKRESFLSHLCFGETDREMVVELFGLLIGTEDHWRAQGASDEEIALSAFAWDQVDTLVIPANRGPLNEFEEQILSDTDTETITRDTYGRTTILPKKVATIALPQNFPLQEPEDWKEIRHWFKPDASRLDTSMLKDFSRDRENGAIVRAEICGAYDVLRELMGDEIACMAVLEEPEMVEDILNTIGDMQEAWLMESLEHTPIDILFIHEDFAGKGGPLVGPRIIRDLFNPYYNRMWKIAQNRGARIFDMDSDGFLDPIIDALLEGGINCLNPNEPASGTDIVKLRKKYGSQLILRGGIDKFALTRGKAAIDAELEYRLDPCLLGGGTMFGLDHRIPGGVSIECYRYYVKRLRDILNLPPIEEEEPGWCRMA